MMLKLGRTRRGAAILTDEERSRHLHVLGASGTGKSKLLESMIRQDIVGRRGLCLIDPHGTLADSILGWCASRGLEKFRRIHVIDPGDLAWSAGFNPLRLDGGTEPSVRVDAMVAACAQVWGGADMATTPRLKKTLKAVFYALAVRDLTLAEAPALTNASRGALRRTLTDGLPDYVQASVWDELNGLRSRDFVEMFESTNNRLVEFLAAPVVRRIVGQRNGALDLRQVMDNDEIVIVNLSRRGGLSPDNVRLLGTLLTSELFLLALGRTEALGKRHPFTLYIDECYQFLTSDIEDMLDQTRKFGLHLVLSHQRLGQLGPSDGPIWSGVMGGGQNKIVFGGLQDNDAEVIARELFRSHLNLQRPKHILDKPVVVDEVPYWLESESATLSEGQSYGEGESSGAGSSSGLTTGEATRIDMETLEEIGLSTSQGVMTGDFTSTGSSQFSTASSSTSTTSGRSQTLRAVRQLLPTAVYSMEEELHRAIVKLRELPNQVAIVKRRGKPPTRFRPDTVQPALCTPTRRAQVVTVMHQRSPFVATREAADAEIMERQAALGGAPPKPHEDETEAFWVR